MASSAAAVAELFELVDVPDLQPRYNIAPTQDVNVIRMMQDESKRILQPMHWGLIPSWAKDPAIGSRMINARAETLAEKPSFRSSFKRRRCLVVADGFYEWKKEGRGKQPYYVRVRDGGPFAFAGLWEHWRGADGSELDSCTIVTTEPNELTAAIHNRMPVILAAEHYRAWLDPTAQETGPLREMLRPYPSDAMSAHPVSTHVNRPGNDNPKCVEPLD